MISNEDDFFEFEEEEDKEFNELLSRFENCVNSGEYQFFDSDEILELVDYYSGWMDREMAQKAIELGLKFYPHSPELLLKKAKLLADQSYTLEALKLLHSIESQMVNDPDFYITKGDIYSQMGLSDQAIKEYKKLLALDYPNKSLVYNIIGSEYLMQNKYEDAIYYLKKSVEYEIENNPALYKVYFCYSELNQLEEAIKYYQKIIDEDPFNADTWLYMSFCHYDLKQYEEALESINFAFAINPSDLLIVLKKSDILKELNRYSEAIELLTDTVKKDPQNTYMLNVLAETFLETSDYEKAAYYFHKALHIHPKDSRSWLGLAKAYVHLSQDSEAIACIQQAVTNSENDPEVELKAGKLYVLMEYYENAQLVLKNLLNKGYDKTEVIVWLCIALEKSGYAVEAFDLVIEQLEVKQNKDVELEYCVAGLLLLYQYRQQGLQMLEKALQKDASKHQIIYEFSPFFEEDLEIQALIEHYDNEK